MSPEDTCPDCYGAGVLDDELCPLCKGRAPMPDDTCIRKSRIDRVVAKAIEDAGLCASMKDYTGAHALLVDAAVEHEKFYGAHHGWDSRNWGMV